jgi:hypothetical protein
MGALNLSPDSSSRGKMLKLVLVGAVIVVAMAGSDARAAEPTVARFLATCPKSDNPRHCYTAECMYPVSSVLLSNAIAVVQHRAKLRICLPRSAHGMDKAIIAIIDWLRIHPEFQDKPQDDGFLAGAKMLYGC